MLHCTIICEKDLATEMLEKVRFFKTIHDGSFDFGEVQADIRLTQTLFDRLEAFQSAGIDIINRGALQHHVFELRVARDFSIESVFDVARIGKVQAFIDPQT